MEGEEGMLRCDMISGQMLTGDRPMSSLRHL